MKHREMIFLGKRIDDGNISIIWRAERRQHKKGIRGEREINYHNKTTWRWFCSFLSLSLLLTISCFAFHRARFNFSSSSDRREHIWKSCTSMLLDEWASEKERFNFMALNSYFFLYFFVHWLHVYRRLIVGDSRAHSRRALYTRKVLCAFFLERGGRLIEKFCHSSLRSFLVIHKKMTNKKN